MNRRRLLRRLLAGSFQGVAFSDMINLQNVGGEAKPYQIRQLLKLVERYDLRLEDEP